MFRSYFVIAYRNLIRNKVFSAINIFGLALGMVAFVLLMQYASFELSYDRFHVNSHNVYRLILESYNKGILQNKGALSYYKASPAIFDSYPQVINYCRLHRADGMVTYNDGNGHITSYFERNGLYADSSFFSVFSFPLVKGNKKLILRKANSLVVSESTAKKYFGDIDPLGKVISLNTEWQGGDYIIEGIFKDAPENSHFKPNFLFAIEKLLTNGQFKNGGWDWANFYHYLLLKPETNLKEFEASISSVIQTNLGSELRENNNQEKFILQPLTKIHLHSNVGGEFESNGNSQLIHFIIIMAFIIMAIAWLNYTNISIAAGLERAKEVGVRKVVGSERVQLVIQFFVESLLLMLTTTFIAILLLIFINPYFITLIGKDIAHYSFNLNTFWPVAIGVLAIGTLLSAVYPALVLSSFPPIGAVKGKFRINIGEQKTRKVLVVFQFSASIVLIIGTFTIGRQIKFMREQSLGMSIDQKLVIRAPRIIQGESFLNEMKRFKNSLTNQASIINVTTSSEVPGKEIFWTSEYKLKGASDEDKRLSCVLAADENFIPTYKLNLLAGRNFSNQHPSDFGGAVIINETEMAVLGIKSPEEAVGKEIGDFRTQEIIGVIKDFQQESLKKRVTPLVIQFIPWQNDYITVSIHSDNIRAEVDFITSCYKRTFPNNAIEYFFLDDFFNSQYKSEEQFWDIFKIAAIVAIFITSIGLFGLSSLTIAKRAKEVGIRKVLGSSEMNIVILLSKDFLRLVIIAFILSIPISYYIMNEWLMNFANRTNIPLWIYLLAGLTVIVIAQLTVSIQAVKAALVNPTKSIRLD